MKKGVLKQGTIWFRSRLLTQDPKNSQSLPRSLHGSDFLPSLPRLPTGKLRIGLERDNPKANLSKEDKKTKK